MCGQWYDDPSSLTAPEPVRPRTVVHSGDRPHRRASIALAVVGTYISELEDRMDVGEWDLGVALAVLRTARDRIAKAESEL